MVLINNLTIDEINAALLHLQRSQGEIVGGNKGNTVQNISITNTSTGVDYSTQIARLEKNVEDLQQADEELKDKDREIIEKLDALGLIGIGIDNLDFDPATRVLSIFTTDGEEYTTTLPSEEVSLTFDSLSNKLVFSMGEQVKEVTLPYINASEKGVANGVATLDATGRVPYSQLPESAMEFKGEWDADTNTPELKDGNGTNGDFYICNVGGTANFGTTQNPRTITFYVNDRVIYQGNVAQWKRLPASEVRTVNGLSGDVVLNGTNVKYSDANNSPTLKDKIDSVETKAETQSDWTQSDTSAIDFIKNKPSLATVATSGSYNDLSNKPTIPAAQIQSDWTQTDSTKKDFIKNKIPIWITSGSADDNMSPIDSVTDGSMRPVTSNAVADIMSNLPTDAVLHYSFDEVPDYPDGTAVYRKNNDFTSTSDWSSAHATLSIVNAKLKVQSNADGQYFQIYGQQTTASNMAGKILKIRCKSNAPFTFATQDNGGSYTLRTIPIKDLGGNEYEIMGALESSYSYTQMLLFGFSTTSTDNYVEISQIYIGDGSYTTPIIDNANGQNNATNNGGIAIQGVSGKGVYFPSANQVALVPFKAPTSNNNFTISLWLKIDNNYETTEYATKPIFCVGSYSGLLGFTRTGANVFFVARDSVGVKQLDLGMQKNVWVNYIAVYNGTTHKFKLYSNGSFYEEVSSANEANYQFGNGEDWRIWGNRVVQDSGSTTTNQPATIDDILIFNRALSETEVRALYLNKANTPKYYSWADWKLSQIS